MNFIVFDLEATCWEGRPADMVQEIIEIGAVKVNRYGEVKGAFSRFVRPVIHPVLSLFCRQLTTIEQISINRSPLFPDIVEEFKEWIGYYDEEEYQLCSWGSFDKNQLMQDCRLHRLEDDWIEPFHINVRKQYHELKGWRRYKGLKKIVEMEGFDFTGTYHRGISDAENLAKLFIRHIDEWSY